MRRATILPVVFIALAVMACTLTSAKEQSELQELKVPGPTEAATVVVEPVEPIAVEEALQTDIVTDPDVFQADLLQAVSDRNFDAFEPLMGSAFSLGYWQSEGGIISTGDAINLMRDDLLSGTNPVTSDPGIDPGSVVNDDIVNYSPGMVRAIFSTGWGESGEDEAILFIASEENTGALYWQGLLYARGGFGASTAPVLAAAEPTEAPPPVQQQVAHGDLIYEHDFRSGWLETDVENGTMKHIPEGYQFAVVEQALWTFTTKTKQGAFYAELEATPGQCPSGQGNYGLLFHFQDDTHYRLFVVWCSGLYSLFQREVSNSIFTISEGNLPAGIDASTGQHKLAVHAEDNVLRLYVDDYLVTTQGVSNMPVGDFGPYAETTGGFPMTVVFNRIAIYQP